MSEGIDDHGIRRDYPLLSENAERHDFAERLGGSTSPLLREIDAALREIWDSRRARASGEFDYRGPDRDDPESGERWA